MHISIFAVGRLKRAPEEDLVRDYTSRLTKIGRHVGISGVAVREFNESSAQTAEQRKSQEAKTLIASLPEKARVVVLDERGENLTSKRFSGLVQSSLDDGDRDLVFVIGGPDGLDETISARASRISISFKTNSTVSGCFSSPTNAVTCIVSCCKRLPELIHLRSLLICRKLSTA